jgi:hypothetical protein
VTVTGFPNGTSLTDAHIHGGAAGTNGGILVSLVFRPVPSTSQRAPVPFSRNGNHGHGRSGERDSWRIRATSTSTFTRPPTWAVWRAVSWPLRSNRMRLVRPGRLAFVGLALLAIAIGVRAQFHQRNSTGRSGAWPRRASGRTRSGDVNASSCVLRLSLERNPLAVVLAAAHRVVADRSVMSQAGARPAQLLAVGLSTTASRAPSARQGLRACHRRRDAAAAVPDAAWRGAAFADDVDGLCEWSRNEATRLVPGGILTAGFRTRTAWVMTAACAWLVLTIVVRVAAQCRKGRTDGEFRKARRPSKAPCQSVRRRLPGAKVLYQSKCQRCHGSDGAGRGPDADPAHPPADLTDARRARGIQTA